MRELLRTRRPAGKTLPGIRPAPQNKMQNAKCKIIRRNGIRSRSAGQGQPLCWQAGKLASSMCGASCRLGRIVAAGVEWMTAQDAAHAAPGSADRPVFVHGFDEERAARGRVAAVRSQPGADQQLIAADSQHEESAGHQVHKTGGMFHPRVPFSLRQARSISRGKASRIGPASG